jgi:hypothetical protein
VLRKDPYPPQELFFAPAVRGFVRELTVLPAVPEAIDPELIALPGPPVGARQATLVLFLCTALASAATLWGLRREAAFAMSPGEIMRAGELRRAPAAELGKNAGRVIAGSGLLGASGAVTFARPFAPDLRFRLMPVAGRDDLWVEVNMPEGEQGARWVPPHEVVGRLERLDALGHRHRGLRAAVERVRNAPLPADTFVIVNGDLPAGNRWAMALAALFLVSMLYNGLMAVRLLRPAR